ncbi:hypothetical protein [Gimesia algae]|uniref:Transcriptional regulator PadR-like family protein n=1 Tax=Gimesia algae TaxID=2527971 RepID=A0A517VMA2_9PLAN|nr:hypothetical protein [Gimesia algae]QDT94151.1 hypothetical protein Pan161_58440 [Gimesia algae]
MLPNLTHLQFFVLSVLLDGQKSGREVRDLLATKHGQKKTLAAFYQLMSRLEESGMVKGWYESKHVEGVTIKERRYEILGSGIKAVEVQESFYSNVSSELNFGGAT